MGIAAESKPVFDPALFNDPLAARIDWHSLRQGGASFRTRRLVQEDLDRWAFKPTPGALLFSLVFMVLGLAAIIVPFIGFFAGKTEMEWGLPIPLLVGSVFTAAGGFMFRWFTRPVVFDIRNGCFWKGRTTPMQVVNSSALKCYAKLEDVHALQLISEYCSGKDSSYFSYELNLVLNSGERLNLFDHGNLKKARSDAEMLGRTLGRPVWDAIQR